MSFAVTLEKSSQHPDLKGASTKSEAAFGRDFTLSFSKTSLEPLLLPQYKVRAIKHSNNKVTIALITEPDKLLITASLKSNVERDLFILIFRHLVAEEAETSKL